MEVTHIHWSGKPIVGGIERHLDSLIPMLNKNGCKSQLICGTGKESEIQIIDSNINPDCALNLEEFYQKNSRIIEQSDIMHFHNGHVISPEKTEALFKFLKKNNKKLVLSIHNIDDCSKSAEILKLPFDAYITYSDFMRRTVIDIFRVESSVLPCYIKLGSFDLLGGQPNNPINILQPTRFSRWKGSYLSLEVITELLNEGQDLVFTHGGCKNLLFGRLRIPKESDKWVDKRKILFQEYSLEEVSEAINSADVILHPTIGLNQFGEPFSLVCLEAMIYSKPIIASGSGFIPELLAGYSRKQIVEAGNKDEFYKAVKRWITQPVSELKKEDIKLGEEWRLYINTSPSKHLSLYSRLLR